MKRKLIAVASITALLCIVLGNSIACTPTTQYDLTISSTAGGNVTEPGEGIFPYNAGTVVTLVATPDAGYHFVEWTGDVGDVAHVEDATANITMNDDYTITANFAPGIPVWDWYDLNAVRNNLGGNHTLMNDIDSTTAGYDELASPTANEGKGWQPIGTFTGTFDGQGYAIKDLFIDRPDEIRVGLFGFVNGGSIEDIGVVNANVTGNNFTGGLVGMNYYGTVSNSYSSGSVTGGDLCIGGLVGNNGGTVSNSYSTSIVTGNNYTGGLVGYSSGTVSNSYSTGSVTGGDLYIGGLVGWNYYGTVSNSYSTGNVSGSYYCVGGLVGDNYKGTVSNSYSTGSVTGDWIVGGLMGENYGNVSNSYSTGSVTGDICIGGLVGQNWLATVSNSYSSGNVTGNTNTGGLAGTNYGNVSNSYSSGNVTGNTHTGGLVGANSGTVSSAYSTGNVTGNQLVGGLVGEHSGNVSNSYSTSSVTGNAIIGGLVGQIWAGGTVSNSYSSGNVTGNTATGGLAGTNYGNVSNAFWDTDTSGQNGSAGGTGKNTTEMKDITTFTDTGTPGLDEPWNISAVANPSARNSSCIWNIVNAETYPFLSWQPA
jgi:hypothetical protein